MAHRVLDEVGHQALHERPVTFDRRALEVDPQLDAAGGGLGEAVVYGVPRGGAEVDRLAPERRLLAARQHHQRVEQRLRAVGGLEHDLAHAAQLGGRGVGIGERHFDLGTDHGQRCAQLVARVGDEAALAVEGGGQAVEHPVDGVGQVAQLVARSVHRDPLVESLLGDALRQPGHLAQRRERAAGHQVAERDRHQQHPDAREQVLRVELIERPLAVAGRQRAVDLAVHDPRADAEQQRTAGSEEQRVEGGQAEAKGHTR